jgi:hypothetical protein
MSLLLVEPRPWRSLGRLAVLLAAPVAILLLFPVQGKPALLLFLLLFAVVQAAVTHSLGHKELLAAHVSFLQPGLRRRLATTQALRCLLAGLLTALVAGLLDARSFPPSTLPVLMAVAMVADAIGALLTFQISWSFTLPAWLFHAFLLLPLLGRSSGDESGLAVVTGPWAWLWVPAALLALAGLIARTRSRKLLRSLCGSLVLGPEDLLKPGRVQSLKSARRRHDGRAGTPAWRQALVAPCLHRLSAAASEGRPVDAAAWALAHHAATQALPRRAWILAFLVLVATLMTLCFGYYDSRAGQDGLDRWFIGLVFGWVTAPVAVASAALVGPRLQVASRRNAHRAELRVIGLGALATTLLGLVVYGLLALLAIVLPELSVSGRVHSFVAPRPQVLLLPPLVCAGLWLAIAMWPRRGATLANLVWFQLYLVGHALLILAPAAYALPITGALTLGMALAAHGLRRRWWLGADLLP